MGHKVTGYLAAAVSAAILVGLWLEKSMYHVPTVDADAYHKRLKAAAAELSLEQGDWVGTDVPVPQAAAALLKPNVLMNRYYRNRVTGRRVSFLLVQCGDARDLLGHYPPVCYPGNGWLSVAHEPRDWRVGGTTITGTQYEFARSTFDRSSSIVIYNFMVLPDGTVGRDMDSVNRSAQDYRRKFFGAAQVQVVFDSSMPRPERDRIMDELIRVHGGLLEMIRDGVQV